LVYGKITKVKETKTKGVYNYYFGLLPDKEMKMRNLVEVGNVFYHQSGKTFSTALKGNVGNTIEIECETFNIEHHLPEDEYKVTLWAPRVMKILKDGKIDTISEAKSRAKKEHCLQEKEIKEGKTIYLTEIEKLHLEQFKQEGIDEDLRNPKKNYKKLFADLRYLFNSAFPKLSEGEKWGDWTMKDVLTYGAKIIDILRKNYFSLIPPKKSEKSYNSSYWKAYRKAEKYMKTKPPKEDEVKEWNKKRREWQSKL
jgi:hypothetical protein